MDTTTGPLAGRTDPAPPRAGRREWTALAVLMLPLLLVSMDVSVLYFAIPFISEDLAPSSTQQLWILDMYGFVLAGLLITMGALGDRVGRRRLVLAGAGVFGLASVAAAYADSPQLLIAVRALLGVGGAALMPSTLALIRNLFHDDKQRAQAVTSWTGVMTLGISFGPVVSGALLEHFWWGSVFLINLPAMALLLVLAPLLLPEVKQPAAGRFDWASAVLSLAGLLPVIQGVKQLARDGWELPPVLSVLAGLALLYVFVRRQSRLAHPLVDLELLRRRTYGGAVLANLFAIAATVGMAVFLTQYLQSVLGKSPFEAALWSLVPATGAFAGAPAGAVLARRFDRGWVMAGGFGVSACGFLALTQVRTDSALWFTLTACAVYTSGLVAAMALANELALGAAPPERAGAAAAVMESGQELGGALGMAVLGSIGAAVYRHGMAHAPGGARETLGGAVVTVRGADLATAFESFTRGLDAAALGAAVLMAGAGVVALARLRVRRGEGAPSPTSPGR
ncbi:MFS transporter [Streptomyces xanthochromogenes]|uniref:MFS transporter n=1 Tax=Streptomyces xanthochromogenes TaxID=67384 RepID=UPI003438E383